MKKIVLTLLALSFVQYCFAASIYNSGSLYGLKDDNGEIVLNAEYSQITQLKYTPTKTILIPMQATDEVKEVESNYYKIKKNGLYGVSNSNGKILHDVKYDDIRLNEFGEVLLIQNGEETVANPVKNTMKATGKTVESIIGLPVTIVAGVMIPIEMISKMGRK